MTAVILVKGNDGEILGVVTPRDAAEPRLTVEEIESFGDLDCEVHTPVPAADLIESLKEGGK